MLTPIERHDVQAANDSGRPVVVLVHGLWMMPQSWEPWREYLDERGFATVAPSWPGEPASVADARAQADALAGVGVLDVTDHVDEVIAALTRKPSTVGHSFGGLIVQQLAGRGSATATVAIDAAPFRGVLPLPIAALRSAAPVLSNPLNWSRTKSLDERQFRRAFTNMLDDDEAAEIFEQYPVPGPGKPLFQAATTNINPFSAARVTIRNENRGPLLVIGSARDNIVPPAISKASYKRQRRNEHAPTEYHEFEDRGHSLVLDHGWRDVAAVSADFIVAHAGDVATTQ